MGQKTRGQIVSEGLLQAGDTSLTLRANVWLNAKLRELYAGWPWPFLQKRASGIALASGATALAFGNGSTETLEVKHIYDPIQVYRSDYSYQGAARIREFLSHAPDEVMSNPATNIGPPAMFRVVPSNSVWGTWSLKPQPIPDRDYLVSIDYLYQPADLSSDASVPIYPSDNTMIHAVYAYACKYLADAVSSPASIQAYNSAESELRELVAGDRLRYGTVPGMNDLMQLDPDTFS